MRKPKVFIASPLFNPLQLETIARIENLCDSNHYDYYSARRDSQPFLPPKNKRHIPQAWDKVFQSNEEGLRECTLMIANLSYQLPEGQEAGIAFGRQPGFEHSVVMSDFKPVELPDSGTVWEMAYFRALGKPVIGFHPEKRGDHLNLMLTHGCDGLISGYEALASFFEYPGEAYYPETIKARVRTMDPEGLIAAGHFNWKACERWTAQQEGLEDVISTN